MADLVADISEALWELEQQFKQGLSVADQVSIARDLSATGAGALTPDLVTDAFRTRGLKPPSRRHAHALLARLRQVTPRRSLTDVLLDYRQFAIRDLSAQFGGRTAGREEELRNNLLTFLPERGYAEARTGKGKTDILLPEPTRIIETKIWESRLRYEDGLTELERYIETERAAAAYMVVFGERIPLPAIITDHRTAIAEQRLLADVLVPVVVVPFEVDPPSRAAANDRRRARA